ncbi:expressed unknown protein [Seminavis robusta]|uniref:Uncharacterized protein n=1 Tax=Seminavis robusta TaxID=568900 RepID=A0A9N8F0V1_9STRA|nr:expressed unknown protein [Seminavis robusta]|eukprot:Sro2472_g328640.1 n/a (157) ;mRNA; r:2731-3201
MDLEAWMLEVDEEWDELTFAAQRLASASAIAVVTLLDNGDTIASVIRPKDEENGPPPANKPRGKDPDGNRIESAKVAAINRLVAVQENINTIAAKNATVSAPLGFAKLLKDMGRDAEARVALDMALKAQSKPFSAYAKLCTFDQEEFKEDHDIVEP